MGYVVPPPKILGGIVPPCPPPPLDYARTYYKESDVANDVAIYISLDEQNFCGLVLSGYQHCSGLQLFW